MSDGVHLGTRTLTQLLASLMTSSAAGVVTGRRLRPRSTGQVWSPATYYALKAGVEIVVSQAEHLTLLDAGARKGAARE